ncbi:MAG: glycosyltransferase [Patescibacteria group bacterium]
MKLVYIANARIPTEKAHGYQIMKMCESFSSLDLKVELVLPTKRNRIKDDLFSFYNINKNFEVRKIKSPDFIGIWPKLGKVSFWLQNIFFSIAILFTKFEKDTVFYTRGAAIVFILRLRGRQVFFESHRLSNNSLVYRMLLGKKTKIISLTEGAKEVYIKSGFLKENIMVAPDAVDLQIFGNGLSVEDARRRVNLPLNKKIIGYFGSFKTMGEDKGLREIIKALAGLPQDVFLLAVGGLGTELQFYEKEAEKMLGQNRAAFRPSVPRKELSFLEESCDILLMPFPDTVHYRFFMSPLKMFEYMASKRPIVTTDLPSIREILDESNAVLVTPGNIEKLKEAIKYLLGNPEVGKKLADNAFTAVKEYTWDKRVEKIYRFMISDF